MLEKFIPKVPLIAFRYWDCFLGICFVLTGLAAFLKEIPHSNGLLLFGFGLTTFTTARQSYEYVEAVRLAEASPRYRWRLAYPKVLAVMLWSAVSWSFFRYAVLDFQITAPWMRWLFRY